MLLLATVHGFRLDRGIHARHKGEVGFDCVEAYPYKAFTSDAEDFVGPADVYRKNGFTVLYETDRGMLCGSG